MFYEFVAWLFQFFRRIHHVLYKLSEENVDVSRWEWCGQHSADG